MVALSTDVETTWKLAFAPLMSTEVTSARPLPLIVTALPTVWLSALTPLTVGRTWNGTGVEAVPPGVVSVSLPFRAVLGTTTSTSPAALETTVPTALPANTTRLVSPRPLPRTFTVAPTDPLCETDAIFGATRNCPALVALPPGVWTVMGPLVAWSGTVTLIVVFDVSVGPGQQSVTVPV